LNTLSFSAVRLGIPGLCVIALTAACSFDASRLRHSHDGADEHPALLDLGAPDSSDDTAVPLDAPTATGGSDTPTATGGVGGSDGPVET
jgi:hypothetical protein